MNKIIIIILLLFLLSTNLLFSDKFEMYKWGMSKNAVKHIEGNNNINEDNEDILSYIRERYKRKCLLTFQFEKNSLKSIVFIFDKKDLNYFLEKLTEKYGNPKYVKKRDRYSWVDEDNNFIGLMDMKNKTVIIIFPRTY